MFKDDELPKLIAGGQYRLVRRLGQGATAVVYEAQVDLGRFDYALIFAAHEAFQDVSQEDWIATTRDRYAHWKTRPREELVATSERLDLPVPRDGRAVVKVLLPEKRDDIRPRFEAEWRQLLSIKHKNLIQVFGGGTEGGVPWYAMELVEGILSAAEVRSLPERAKLDLVRQAAAGLAALHERGLVHRDMKPGNLLCNRLKDGKIHVRVIDLGIAKDTSRIGLTQSHQIFGTPYYMSPEQASSTKRVDWRADIYSLGATLYALVLGVRPFEGQQMYDILGHLVRGDAPKGPREVKPDLDPEVSRLIERMMEPDAESRLQTMAEVGQAVEAVLAADRDGTERLLRPRTGGKTTQKRAPGPARGGAPAAGRRGVRSGLIIAGLLLVVVALAVALVLVWVNP